MIIRAPRPEGNFTQIRNEVLRDASLSYRARGVLAAVLSYPDNWQTNAEGLSRRGGEGRDAIRTCLKELEQAGYILTEKIRDDEGKFRTVTRIFDEPQRVSSAGYPTTDFQALKEQQEDKNTVTTVLSDDSVADDSTKDEPFSSIHWSDDVIALTNYLGDKIDAHFDSKKNRPESWFKDMDLLLRRGPLGWTEEPPPAEKVRRLIDWIFDQEPRNGFCWADNIQSPKKLREKYVRLRQEANDSVRGKRTAHQDTLDAIDRVFSQENHEDD